MGLEFIRIPYILGRKVKIMQCPLTPCGARDGIIRFSKLVGSSASSQGAAIIIQHCFTLGITSLSVFFIASECQSCSSASVVAHSGLSECPQVQVQAALARLAQPQGTCQLLSHLQPWAGCHMPPKYMRSGYFLAQPAVWSSALVQGLY